MANRSPGDISNVVLYLAAACLILAPFGAWKMIEIIIEVWKILR